MILESVESGPLFWPTIEENGVTRLKKYSKLSTIEAIQADYDVKATNIILLGLSLEVYALQERECKLYDEFDKFTYMKGESLRDYYLRFSLLLNDKNIYNMKLEQFQMMENHLMDRLVKDVLMMEFVMHTEKNDIVFHTEKTGMLILMVEIDVGGMTADVFDKLTCSSDDVQPRQVDLRCAHALTELHWHDIHVDPDRHEVDQR
nr:hypothetical protein [Tanacetum cinerariifolium]